MRNHLLDHLSDMVQVAALRTDENAVAILHRIRHMADTLPTYFDARSQEEFMQPIAYGSPRVGTSDTGMAVKAAQEEHAARHGDEAEGDAIETGERLDAERGLPSSEIVSPDPAKELRPNEELFHQ